MSTKNIVIAAIIVSSTFSLAAPAVAGPSAFAALSCSGGCQRSPETDNSLYRNQIRLGIAEGLLFVRGSRFGAYPHAS